MRRRLNSPFAWLTLYSSYGAGGNVHIWQASSREGLAHLKKPQDILTAAFGGMRGEKIFSPTCHGWA